MTEAVHRERPDRAYGDGWFVHPDVWTRARSGRDGSTGKCRQPPSRTKRVRAGGVSAVPARQKSMREGTTRTVVQPAGIGSVAGSRAAAAANAASTAPGATAWSGPCRTGVSSSYAHATSCNGRGRVGNATRDVSGSSSSAVPASTTCRPSAGQWNTADTRGFAAMSTVLRVGVEEWNRRESASRAVTSTVRACGTPSAPAVASVIVLGPGSPAASASPIQRASTARGPPSTSIRRPCPIGWPVHTAARGWLRGRHMRYLRSVISDERAWR